MNYRVYICIIKVKNVKFKGANVKHEPSGKQIKKEENDS